MRLFGNPGKRLRGGVVLCAVAISALLGVPAFAMTPDSASTTSVADQAPKHEKTITDNGDGTYDLTLSVVGDSEESSESTPIDVIVVQDISGSMNDAGGYTYSYSSIWWDRGRGDVYGLVDGEYVQLTRTGTFVHTYYYTNASGQTVQYTGTLYERTQKAVSRLDVAKDALDTLADELIADANSDVQISLVTFSTHSSTASQFFKGGEAETFKAAVSQLRANGGTNWEAALNTANSTSSGRTGAKKYIVFLSDGDPTYRDSKYNDRADDWNGRDRVYGNGNSDPDGWNYGAAKDVANKRDTSVGMFVVGTSTDATKMNSFATDVTGKYLDGTSQEKLKAAFEEIVDTITKSTAYKDVKIVDTLSDYVDFAADAEGVVSVSYEKGKGDAITTWTDAPAATVNQTNGTVTWDLSSVGSLEKGVTYQVTFTIKPNQDAYDAAAEAGEETKLPSNDGDNTKVFYKTITKETGKPDVVSDEKSDTYNVPTITVPVDTVTVNKVWKNTGDATLPASVTVQLQKDGEDYGDPIVLTADDNWTKTVIVPAGVGEFTWSAVETAVDDYDTTYSAAVTGSGTLTVTNTHKTWPVTLEGETAIKGIKTLTGHDMTSAFNFKLVAAENYGDKVVIAKGADSASASGAKDGVAADFSFGAITFTAAGTYKFNVTETGEAPAGYTYDTHTSVVTVEVVEKDGKLVATTSYADGTSCVFKNSYEAKSVTVDGKTNFSFTKVLQGRDLKAGEFSFQIEATSNNNAPLPEKTTVTNAADGTFNFGDITYTKAGVYTYSVSEDTSSLPSGVSAVTQGAKQVTVTVTDNNEGQLVAEVTSPEDKTFKNTYKAESTVIESILTTKVISATQDGVTPPALKGGDFSFTISSTDGPLPDVKTVTNDASGSVAFGKITFTAAGVYHYTISESGSMPGVTNDAEAKTFTVTVVDNLDGTMTATASKIAGFVNTYTVEPVEYSVTTDVKVTKSLEGRELKDGEFTFQLVDGEEVVAESNNDAGGDVYFQALKYTSDDLGEHTYKVREVKGSLTGVDYDDSEYTVTVTVSNNGDGTLSAVATADVTDGIVFYNKFTPPAIEYSVTTDVKVTKVLHGRDLQKGEFTFQLVDAEGNVVDTATNAADGTVRFKAQTYTEEGVYDYTIREVAASSDDVVYDTTEYPVTVNVTASDDGTLSAKATRPDTDPSMPIEFNNTYIAVTATIEATKTLTGANLADGQFTFELKDSNGKVVATAKNDANGNIKFSKVFTKAGKYVFTLSEVNDKQDNVTYDTTSHKLTVNVTQNEDGTLKAQVETESGKSIVFNNTYSVPKKKTTPKTGDVLLTGGAIAAVAGTGALGVAVSVIRRKKK